MDGGEKAWGRSQKKKKKYIIGNQFCFLFEKLRLINFFLTVNKSNEKTKTNNVLVRLSGEF